MSERKPLTSLQSVNALRERVFIDGSSSEKVGPFSVWSLRLFDGALVSNFHGPMSMLCAVRACASLNGDPVPSSNVLYYEENDYRDRYSIT